MLVPGRSQRASRRPQEEPPGGPRRGPPARLHRLRGRRSRRATTAPATVKIWDTRHLRDREVATTDEVDGHLPRRAAAGRYVLFQTKGKDWMIHRMDPPADPDARADAGRARADAARSWRRCRAERRGLASRSSGTASARSRYIDRGRLRLVTRNGNDVTRRIPSCARWAARWARATRCSTARSSHSTRTAGRASSASSSACTCRRRRDPAPREDSGRLHDLRRAVPRRPLADALPYTERRELLEALKLDGRALADARRPRRRRQGVARRRAGEQRAGGRGRQAPGQPLRAGPAHGRLAKVKNTQRQELVIGGWLPGEGGRREHRRRSAGLLRRRRPEVRRQRGHRLQRGGPGGLKKLLAPLRRDAHPFAGRQPKKGTVFVEPKLVAEAEFLEWTRTATLRAPSFKGLRDDRTRAPWCARSLSSRPTARGQAARSGGSAGPSCVSSQARMSSRLRSKPSSGSSATSSSVRSRQ